MKRYAALIAVLAACLLTANAAGGTTDPRKCSTGTPGGAAHHAYWCAHNAAVAAVRTKMAALQHKPVWYAPTFCNQNVSLLRWKCVTILGGDNWAVSVVWRGTSAGWKQQLTVVKTR